MCIRDRYITPPFVFCFYYSSCLLYSTLLYSTLPFFFFPNLPFVHINYYYTIYLIIFYLFNKCKVIYSFFNSDFLKQARKNQNNQSFDIFMFNWLTGRDSVSYTHLDVYKRQVIIS